jgi:hypothetical protein
MFQRPRSWWHGLLLDYFPSKLCPSKYHRFRKLMFSLLVRCRDRKFSEKKGNREGIGVAKPWRLVLSPCALKASNHVPPRAHSNCAAPARHSCRGREPSTRVSSSLPSQLRPRPHLRPYCILLWLTLGLPTSQQARSHGWPWPGRMLTGSQVTMEATEPRGEEGRR